MRVLYSKKTKKNLNMRRKGSISSLDHLGGARTLGYQKKKKQKRILKKKFKFRYLTKNVKHVFHFYPLYTACLNKISPFY